MNVRAFGFLALAAFAFVGCGKQDASTGTPSEGLGIPSGTYAVDKTHAYLTFSYLHQGLSYPLIRATALDGELVLDASDLSNSRTAIAVEVESIRSNTDYFDKELASAKFFNAAKFPHITFVSERYDATSETEGQLHGLVTVRGITQPLLLNVRINGAMENPITNKPVIGFSASGRLKRSDFELDRFIPAVADQVDIAIEVEFAQGSSDTSAAAVALAETATGEGSAD